MTNKKHYEKIAGFDLHIKSNANKNEWERYDAALAIISYNLFKENIGIWGGRETSIGKPKDRNIVTNYWYVIESGMKTAKKQIERIIKNFNLTDFVELEISSPAESEKDFKSIFINRKELTWSWHK